MGYILVAAIAKVLGKDPQDLWLSTVRWTIRFGLAFVAFVLLYAAAGWTVERLTPEPPAPVPVEYIDDGLVHTPNRPSVVVG